MWLAYRQLFIFPVWFDETVGKAVFFGLPVWLYTTVTRTLAIPYSFSSTKLKAGLLLGVAVGGVYGFVGTIVNFLIRGVQVQAAPLFSSLLFWWEFGLALLTGFWETLFFYSFVMNVIIITQRRWSAMQQILITAGVFWVFHLPNVFLHFHGWFIIWQLGWLALFATGQAFLFARHRNAYTLVLSHAIWGMVLLIHLR